ncbi:MAG: ATP-binding protein [Terrimicrobiaceae bacterium]
MVTRFSSSNDETSLRLGLHWLIRVRWLVLMVYAALSGGAFIFLGIQIPWVVFVPCLTLLAAGNLACSRLKSASLPLREAWIAALLLGDILLLTVILFFAGGAHNPFTLFYILYVVLVAILLPGWMPWLALLAAAGGFATLFFSPYPLISVHGGTCCNDMTSHLYGMVAAMTLTGAALTYFVNRLGKAVVGAEKLVAASRNAQEDSRRFASLATLAAGVAHELATPLGTIAIASRELENQAGQVGCLSDCAADARLIRSEVDRCRAVLERLSQQAVLPAEERIENIHATELPGLIEPHLPAWCLSRLRWDIGTKTFRAPLGGLLRSLAILVKNACEASDGPVQIVVSTKEAATELRVIDQGCGMPAEMLERLGEPFFTSKGASGGMGLGLFLVRLFCEQHDGRLIFRSSPGSGTEASMRLPCAQQA